MWYISSDCKLTNRPNSAGMGPGVYKTQSKHTKNKSPCIKKASLFLNIECKSGKEGWSQGKRDVAQSSQEETHFYFHIEKREGSSSRGERKEGVPVKSLHSRLRFFSFRRNRNPFDIVP